MEGDSKVEQVLDGQMPPHARQAGTLRCDRCLLPIAMEATASVYVTNRDVLEDGEKKELRARRMYCDECNHQSIQVPHKPSLELLYTTEFEDDGGVPRFTNVDVLHHSVPGEGIDWNPVDVWEAFMEFPLEQMGSETPDSMGATPEDVSDVLAQFGVHIRPLLDENGNLDVTDETLKSHRKRIKKKVAEMDV